MNDLRDLVDDLTLPRNVKVDTDDGSRWAVEDALLVQLADAVSASIGGTSRGASLAWTRNMLDADALMHAARISAAIGDWCRNAGAPVTRDPVTDLRAWHQQAGADAGEFYRAELDKWVRLIRGLLNPPRVIEVQAACPLCGASSFESAEKGTVKWPVRVQFWDGTGVIRGECGACSHVWDGELALRALRWDIDIAESA